MTATASQEDDLRLLRAFEPVLKLTRGESFIPVDVAPYVANAAIWQTGADGEDRVLAKAGTVDLSGLAEAGAVLPGPGQSLSVINLGGERPKGQRRLRDRRARLKGGSRLSEVGLIGRLVDALSRLTLLFRGKVAGGSAAISLQVQKAVLEPDRPYYHGRVVRSGGYIVCQYWFFYCFNNWRSGFGGVNEHEADWEQVTIYLDESGGLDADGLPMPRWVVFSAHDEVGDDLRRRWDDPDLSLVDGRHPVVFAGAGSHSGAYLPGDYLITVEPPSLGGAVKFVRSVARIITPWSNSAQGVGIPYVDYARGDGLSIGPGQRATWSVRVVDDATDWVRDYRGLWGHDTKDRFGGERGPAGPRYERDGTVRASWADPVGWAGLSKVPPNPAEELEFVQTRIEEIDAQVASLEAEVVQGRAQLRTQMAGLAPNSPEVAELAAAEEDLLRRTLTATSLIDERERLERLTVTGSPSSDPHAHLHHRRTPIVRTRRRQWLLSAWSVISTPLILIMLSRLVLPTGTTRTGVLVVFLVLLLSVEAFARGYFVAWLVRAAAVVALGVAVYFGIEDWQIVLAAGLSLTALLVLLVNLRDALWR